MPRKSMREQRTVEILEAFGRCLNKFGLEGVTLENIAEEANMQRSILRHYIGNREDIIDAYVNHVAVESVRQTRQILSQIPKKRRVHWFVDLLFDDKYISENRQAYISGMLVSSIERHPALRDILLKSVDDFIEVIAEEIRDAYPEATEQQCWIVSNAVSALYINYESLFPLGLKSNYHEGSLAAIHVLLDSLGPNRFEKPAQ